MSLQNTLTEDLKAAQKAGDSDKVGILRFLLSQLQNKAIEKRASGKGETLADEEVMDVLQKEVKKRREAVELYTKGGRADLADKEEKEIGLIAAYLPKPLSREEIESAVANLAAEHKDFNSLMKAAMQQLKGKADGKTVGEIVKAKLDGSN